MSGKCTLAKSTRKTKGVKTKIRQRQVKITRVKVASKWRKRGMKGGREQGKDKLEKFKRKKVPSQEEG